MPHSQFSVGPDIEIVPEGTLIEIEVTLNNFMNETQRRAIRAYNWSLGRLREVSTFAGDSLSFIATFETTVEQEHKAMADELEARLDRFGVEVQDVVVSAVTNVGSGLGSFLGSILGGVSEEVDAGTGLKLFAGLWPILLILGLLIYWRTQ